ncbi:hypothetical protein DFH94DRAFT_770701 [Russula ochroleuca]|uniref:Uncharacterized protein n=1 Tax=Russula ochroleuca TaxID=152965 RepID=A0A9P5JXV1_9AGAM|nr:hypothetical protein DFH94DRAFT_770701 [Russula ochroleuca]
MDPRLTPEPSSHSHYSAPSPNYNEQDYSASRSQAEALLGNIQGNGLEEGLNIGELSSLHPSSHLSPLYGSEYPSVLYHVPNVPNHQLRSSDRSFLPLEGVPCLSSRVSVIEESLNAPVMTALVSLGLTRDHVPDLPFPTDRNDADIFHAAYTQYRANRQMKQAEIENHHPLSPLRDIYGASGVSASPESSSAELYAQSGMQDDYAGTTFPRGQVDGTTLSLAGTQRQSTTMQKAFRKGQQKQRKKVRDMVRKREQRSDDDQHFVMICGLLGISYKPKNTLVRRILDRVGELVEQRKLDDDLRRQLVTGEADFTAQLDQPSAATDTSSSFPLNEHSALDGSDIGETPRSWPWSSEEWDERHN